MNLQFKREIVSHVKESNTLGTKTLSILLLDFYSKSIDIEVKEETEYTSEIEELFLPDEQISEIVYLLKKKKNVILQGAPGVGKTFTVRKIIKSHFQLKNPDEQIKTVQFHQSFSYEEFIEGLRPRSYDSGFSITPGIFKQFIDESVMINPEEPYFLIIDEINRGNLSKIFGELLMLIEADKRDIEKVILPYSNDEFLVPSNLYIIGTMNTADRSLALMDYALRRRFSFVTLKPMYNTDKFNDHLMNIGLSEDETRLINQNMLKINEFIHNDFGPNFEIGHSYFVDTKVMDFKTWYSNIIKYDIIPILREYYFDDEDKLNDFLKELGLI